MKFSSSLALVSSFLLLTIVSTGCQAQLAAASQYPLTCYICDNCATVTDKTPTATCDAEYFANMPTTMLSTMTTTEEPTTETSTEEETESSSSSTESSSTSTTPMPSSSSTTEEDTSTTEDSTSTTEEEEDTSSTTKVTMIPTPPTIGPEITTTGVPTPPNPGVAASVDMAEQKTSRPLTLVRQRRQAMEAVYTYHCYSVQMSVNGTAETDRGCSRVTTEQGVCSQLAVENPGASLSKCNPCTGSLCNSSGAFGVPLLALLLGVFVSLLRGN